MTLQAQIHRFRDTVAVYLGDGGTVYIRPKDAIRLGNELKKCAQDCKQNTFQESTYTVKYIGLPDARVK